MDLMVSKIIRPRNALNKAYLKVKPKRSEIECFKKNLVRCVDGVNTKESEEFHKNLINEFLSKTYYSPEFYINTKDRNDLVIHNNKSADSSVGVIIECKSPSNKAEMPKHSNLNVKAIHELLLYFLNERIAHSNLEIRNLIVTNLYEWFIFDAAVFEKLFIRNKKLVKAYQDFVSQKLSGTSTEFFYTEIAKPAIEQVIQDIEYTYFDLRKIVNYAKSQKKEDDLKLIPLFKVFSPTHILKLSFQNDSNTLDKKFYAELLHLIGLNESKKGAKKLIERVKLEKRQPGSLLENAILQIDVLDKLGQLDNPENFGSNREDRLFGVALELCITWINRILFIKLLEAQLLAYHKGDKKYELLVSDRLNNFDDLNLLFFQVLARDYEERSQEINDLFPEIPYLNSSLFEPTRVEHATIFISNLQDHKEIDIFSKSVLKDKRGKKLSGRKNTLEYLFEFLSAYDFGSVGREEIQEENKVLINASVLGLIFEKINGYKDGSFFTPGFVTMYMCRQTIREAIVQKFNTVKGWSCNSLDDVYELIEDNVEANAIVNSIRVCDPAVGSGHFLVSALNEILVVKHELKILLDLENKRLKEYDFEVVNDELVITDEEGQLFEYRRKSPESTRVQGALFVEKQCIIENCLFGVDVNHNSVKICRLRLWIELLKSAYYKEDDRLETLPNIDINIKVGDSLVSRFKTDADIGEALRNQSWDIAKYRDAVHSYRNADSKQEKSSMEGLISLIKHDFRAEISKNDPDVIRRERIQSELFQIENQAQMFGYSGTEKRARKSKIEKLKSQFNKLDIKIKNIEKNVIYEDAFEWRFEFPEILTDEGNFQGFDALIVNPPYGVSIKGLKREHLVEELGKVPDFEIYYWFIERAYQLLSKSGVMSYIVPNTLLFNVNAANYRLALIDKWKIDEVLDCTDIKIFDDATVRNVILNLRKTNSDAKLRYRKTNGLVGFDDLISRKKEELSKVEVSRNNANWGLLFKLDSSVLEVIDSMRSVSKRLDEYFDDTSQGLIAYDKHQGQSKEIIESRAYHVTKKTEASHKKWLLGEDVVRYSVSWNKIHYVDYCEGIANPRKPKYFNGKRILVREITNPRIYAALTDEELYNDPAIIVIKDGDGAISIEALLGILNSKLASFFHFNASPKATKGSFPKILVADINGFPLPAQPNQSNLDILKSLVLKKMGPHVEPSQTVLDQQIDELVYKLYDLDDDQVAIVEAYFD